MPKLDLVLTASVSLGAATAALEATREHLHVRKQFNKALKDFQVSCGGWCK